LEVEAVWWKILSLPSLDHDRFRLFEQAMK